MFILGLTGSIGMGKSTTAGFFREAGVPVHDADAVVHRLHEGEAVAPVEAAFPGTAVDGRIDRGKLSEKLVGNPDAIKRLEAIVHPLVRAASQRFMQRTRRARHARRSCSISRCCSRRRREEVDAVVVVSAPAEVQRARVLSRPGMTAEKARRAAGAPDAGCRKARARAFRRGQLALVRLPVHRFMAFCARSRRLPGRRIR